MAKKKKQKAQIKKGSKAEHKELDPRVFHAKLAFTFDSIEWSVEFDPHDFADKTLFEIIEPGREAFEAVAKVRK